MVLSRIQERQLVKRTMKELITTSTFTKEAREYTLRNETKIVLVDGEELAQLMFDYNLGGVVAKNL